MFLLHSLGNETCELIRHILDMSEMKLVIYSSENWAIENTYLPGALSFNPSSDSEHLRKCLQEAIQRRRV